MTKIFIAGYYGLGNIGDEAILTGIIESITKFIEDAEFVILTNNPVASYKLHKVRCVKQSFNDGFTRFIYNQIFQKEIINLNKAIGECDIFIFGGGELLQDLKFHYLPLQLSLINLAQKKGKKTVIYGIGAGPIDTRFGKWLIKNTLSKTDLITVRDTKSKKALEACGLEDIITTADPAFAIPTHEITKVENNLNNNHFKDIDDYFAITIHHRPYNDDKYRKSNGKSVNIQNIYKNIAMMLENVYFKYDRKLLFLSTVKEDKAGYDYINNYFPPNVNRIILEHTYDFKQFNLFLSKAIVLIGMRLHSMIFATKLGIPFIPISYSSKVNSFLEMMDLKQLEIPIEHISRQDFEIEIMEKLSTILKNRSIYSNYLIEKSKHLYKIALNNGKLVAGILNRGA